MRMKVSSGGSCLDMNRTKMFPGTEFEVVARKEGTATNPRPEYGPRQIPQHIAEDWMRSGHAEPVRDGEHPIPNPGEIDFRRHERPGIPASVAEGDGRVENRPGGTEGSTRGSRGSIIAEHGVRPDGSPGPVVPNPAVTGKISPWSLNPKTIQGMNLDQLNAMIGERMDDHQRKGFKPYATVPEAIAHLTQDFKPEGQAAGAQ